MNERIKLMGVELEGWWRRMPYGGKGFKRDVSVSFESKCRCCSGDCCHYSSSECFCECSTKSTGYVGELPSQPQKIVPLMRWIKGHYPNSVNDTCGFHIHVSFYNQLDYARIMDGDFFNYFYLKLNEFGHNENITQDSFWYRLQGKNLYCRKVRNMYSNMWFHKCNRTAINVSAFHAHGTVELRLLPMFERKEDALKAVKYIHDIINNYLNLHNKKEKNRMIKICV